jgi:hypothetical protein
MSEEEKKALKYLRKNVIARIDIDENGKEKIIGYGNTHKYIILKLIKRQQKELKELKEINANLVKTRIEDLREFNKIQQEDYIIKDKIREHLKKFEEIEEEFIFIDNKSTAREINKALIEFSKRLLEE